MPDALICRLSPDAATVTPGRHSWDGGYTDLRIAWHGHRWRMQNAHDGGDVAILVTPLPGQSHPLCRLASYSRWIFSGTGGGPRAPGRSHCDPRGGRRYPGSLHLRSSWVVAAQRADRPPDRRSLLRRQSHSTGRNPFRERRPHRRRSLATRPATCRTPSRAPRPAVHVVIYAELIAAVGGVFVWYTVLRPLLLRRKGT